jgi:hypothetical protein
METLTPLGQKFFTTWNWWAAIAVSALHLLGVTPKFLAAGFFPLSVGVALTGSTMHAMCNTTDICSTRRYREYTKKYRLKNNTFQWDEVLSSKNLSTHIFPLLLISVVLLIRPSHSTFLQRVIVSSLFAITYNMHAVVNLKQDIKRVYGMEKRMYGAMTAMLLLFCLIPV